MCEAQRFREVLPRLGRVFAPDRVRQFPRSQRFSSQRSQVDGTRLIEQYSDLGLLLAPAENAVEAGLYAVWERLSDGRLFVFSSLQNWLSEFRIYRRDEKGKIVKQNDHLMDATRYLILSGPTGCLPRTARGRRR